MPRYAFATPARAALLDELIAAGLAPTTPVEFDGALAPDGTVATPQTTVWVTADAADRPAVEAVVAAHDAAAIDAAAAQEAAADADDTGTMQQALLALQADIPRLEDSATVMTAQQVRNALARTDRAVVAILRKLHRRET